MPRLPESTRDAVKKAVDIVALAGDYGLRLQRSGSKFKALCPFHDDHNPSLTIDPDRQSYKCWSCGAGGDVIKFVQDYDRVEFPEALRMLAERAGISLETAHGPEAAPAGPSKSELLAVCAWAERQFSENLTRAAAARAYIESRGISPTSVARFHLGYAPDERDWLSARARRDGFSPKLLELTGLMARSEESSATYDRFRGRLMFPIHDLMGRTIGFGGRILPVVEKSLAEAGRKAAKYLNSPETPLFQKRRHLYAADLARPAAREAGWVAVVEGYTDVIAAHQAGLANVVGTLGTALGEEHIQALRSLADRVVLVFDGDEAGQKAADRTLEMFLGHEVDLRVLTLPEGLDPCDFLMREGAAPFRAMIDGAVDPLDFAIDRAEKKYDLDELEGARQASEWVLGLLAASPRISRVGVTVKVGQALNRLADRLRLPLRDRTLADRLGQLLKQKSATPPGPRRGRGGAVEPEPKAAVSEEQAPAIRPADLDPLDRELVQIALDEPEAVPHLVARVAPGSLRDAPLRAILQACYDAYAERRDARPEEIVPRLRAAERSLAAELLRPIDPQPLSPKTRPAPWSERLARSLERFEERERRDRLRDLKAAMGEVDPDSEPERWKALRSEYYRLLINLRPEARPAS